MKTDTPPNVWTVADVARWLGLTDRQVSRLARCGKIPSRVLPTGEMVFDPAALAHWFGALPHAGEEAAHAAN
jgi:hypothetical protein